MDAATQNQSPLQSVMELHKQTGFNNLMHASFITNMSAGCSSGLLVVFFFLLYFLKNELQIAENIFKMWLLLQSALPGQATVIYV